jgi:hypothetical protein
MNSPQKNDVLERLRESAGVSANMYQATIAMIAIFIGFVFSGLLQILLSPEMLTTGRLFVVWFLSISMASLSFSLFLFHAMAHQSLRYWQFVYVRSKFNINGARMLEIGLLLMFISVAALAWEKGLRLMAVFIFGSAVGLISFGSSLRGMHKNATHVVDIDKPSPWQEEGP